MNLTGMNVRYLAIVLLSVALYANTISHGFVMDDGIVIIDNAFTVKGLKGIPEILTHDAFVGFLGEEKNLVAGGRYRPLSVVTFAVEYELFGRNPLPGHAVNIILYALTGVLMFRILTRVLGGKDNSWLSVPFVATILFVTHPLHTEVVANIKSRDEIMALLLALWSLDLALTFVHTRKLTHLAGYAVAFFTALLSKENAIIFLVVTPAVLIIFARTPWKKTLPVLWLCTIVTALFLVIRWTVVGGLGTESDEVLNNAYLYASTAQRYATIVLVLGKYLLLSIIPHPLTHDYYYNQIPLADWSNLLVLMSTVAYLTLTLYVVLRLWRRDVGALGIFIFLAGLSIVSNIVVPVGTTMAERFTYLPSLGVCITMGWSVERLGTWVSRKGLVDQRTFLATALLLIAGAYSVKTVTRNPAWTDNFTLFATDIATSPNSAKLRNAIGGELVIQALKLKDQPDRKKAMLSEAIDHLSKAVEIHPGYAEAWFSLGNAYYERDGAAERAIEYYNRSIGLGLPDITVHRNLGIVYKGTGQPEKAIAAFRALVATDTLRAEAFYHIGTTYLEIGNADSAVTNLLRSMAIDSINPNVYNQLGIAYGRNMGDIETSLRWMEKAVALGVANYDVFVNLGIAYATRGEYSRAIEFLTRATTEDPGNPQAYANLSIVYRQMNNIPMAEEFRKKSEEIGSARR